MHMVGKENSMKEYIHTVQYYETDKMGITHHSNYVRWMEEARVVFLKEIGYPFEKLEELGIVSPTLSVSCEYKKTTTFTDRIAIEVTVREYRGVKLFLSYEMKNEAGDVVCTAQSSHALLNTEGRPVNVKKEFPDLHRVLTEMVTPA